MWFYLRGGLFGGAVERHPVRFKGTGEFVVIVGSSGSGKTTLLSIFSGLDRPTSGRVVMAGRDFTDLSEEELAPVRNTLPGFVFQAYHLAPSLNALENVMFPAELRGDEMAMEKVHKLIERYGSMMGDWSKAGRDHDSPLALSLAGRLGGTKRLSITCIPHVLMTSAPGSTQNVIVKDSPSGTRE